MKLERGALSRRGFLDRSMAALTARRAPLVVCPRVARRRPKSRRPPRPRQKKRGPNDQIVMAAIGVGGQGTGIMKWAKGKPGVKFIAVCDLDAAPRQEGREGSRQGLPRVQGLPRAARQGRPRRRHRRHGRPLARLDLDRRDEGRLRRLLREAALLDHRGRQGDGPGGPEVRPRLPDRQPAAVRRPLPAGLRAGAQRPDRQGAHRRGPHRRQPDRRPVRRRPRSPKGSTGSSGKAPRRRPLCQGDAAITSSAGGTTIPAASSPTGARTTTTSRNGASGWTAPAR